MKMVILKIGLNRIRDLHYADVDKGELGTDGTVAYETDTGLITPVAATQSVLTKVSSDVTNTFTYTLLSSAATNQTFREFTTMNSASSINYDRITFTGILHTDNDVITLTKIYVYRNA
jgi:hypothetical protein